MQIQLWFATGAVALCVVLCGCGSEGRSNEKQEDAARIARMTDELRAVCELSCDRQMVASCPSFFSRLDCIQLCMSEPGYSQGCGQEWIDLNQCLAQSQLFCDANMNAAASDDDCGQPVAAYEACVAPLQLGQAGTSGA